MSLEIRWAIAHSGWIPIAEDRPKGGPFESVCGFPHSCQVRVRAAPPSPCHIRKMVRQGAVPPFPGYRNPLAPYRHPIPIHTYNQNISLEVGRDDEHEKRLSEIPCPVPGSAPKLAVIGQEWAERRWQAKNSLGNLKHMKWGEAVPPTMSFDQRLPAR